MERINLVELCAGYGSQALAFKQLGLPYDIVAWSEFDPESKKPLDEQPAVIAHNLLHPEAKGRNLGDMTKIDWKAWRKQHPQIEIDLLTYSTPCQSISQAGLQHGLTEGSGTRSSILWYTENAIRELLPKYLLQENVKALISRKFLPDFLKWQRKVEALGYTNYWKVMNAKDYGVPQNRERECLWYQSVMILRGILSLFLIPENCKPYLPISLNKMPTKASSLKTRWWRSSSVTTRKKVMNISTESLNASLQRASCKRF